MVNIIHAYLEREKPSGVQNKGLPVSVCLLCYPKNEKKSHTKKRESEVKWKMAWSGKEGEKGDQEESNERVYKRKRRSQGK